MSTYNLYGVAYIVNNICYIISFQSFLTVQNVTSSKRDITYIKCPIRTLFKRENTCFVYEFFVTVCRMWAMMNLFSQMMNIILRDVIKCFT